MKEILDNIVEEENRDPCTRYQAERGYMLQDILNLAHLNISRVSLYPNIQDIQVYTRYLGIQDVWVIQYIQVFKISRYSRYSDIQDIQVYNLYPDVQDIWTFIIFRY